jgi:pyrophosphate--fructose-6-phosphate 1-phosphotransferase
MPCSLEKAFSKLSHFSVALLKSFPAYIQLQIMSARMDNGQIHASQVQTEQLLADMVAIELQERKVNADEHPGSSKSKFVGAFSPVCQFIGYQVRCSMPSDFDSEYGRALGGTAAILAANGHNGYMATVSGLADSAESWRCAGVPISAICSSTDTGVRVTPAPLKLHSPVWRAWSKIQAQCAIEDLYQNPGPIQLSGSGANRLTETLLARTSQWGEASNYLSTLDELSEKIEMLQKACRPGCEVSLARLANRNLGSIEELLSLMSEHRMA